MYRPKNEPVPVGYQPGNIGDTSCSINVGSTNPENPNALKREITPEGGSTLSFHDIHYTVQVKAGRCRKANKTILKGISGVFKPGLNAILGPTGGGKTTLLDILSARKDPHGMSGRVLLNGKPLPSNFRLISGYVPQEDIVLGTLTVRENLTFSAALRLPSSVSENDRKDRVEDVLTELSLVDCADTRIGNELTRGVSGGEKRRTSVGMELIIQPRILYLDEPTSGLDASTAGSLMTQLSRMAQKGRTIIFSIHQPRYQIYRLFNTLHLLASGETVYHGDAATAEQFFAESGYTCEDRINPTDFFLDTIIQNNTACSDFRSPGTVLLTESFQRSDHYSHMKTEADTLYARFKLDDDEVVQKITYQTSFLTQMKIVGQRTFLNYARNPNTSVKQIASFTFIALFTGFFFFQLSGPAEYAIQDRAGPLFFICLQLMLMNFPAMDAFIADRTQFIHELSNGYYRTSAFFLSKIMFDLIPQRTIPTVFYGTAVYWMIGFRSGLTHFLLFLLNIVLSVYAYCSYFILVGCFCTSFFEGVPFIQIFFLANIFSGGFLVNVASLPIWISWLKHVSLFRYSLKTVLANEFSGRTFCDPYPNNATCYSGDAFLEAQDVDDSSWGIWTNQIMLASVAVAIFILAYIRIRKMPKFK